MALNSRINYLDYAKALSIFFVISIHVGFYQLNSFALFAMPLFFVVTGYSFTAGKRSVKDNIFLRFKSIMLPFWIFMLSFAVLEVIRAYLFGYGDYRMIFPAFAKAIYGSGIIPFENNITAYLKEIMSYKAHPSIGVDTILPISCHLWFLPATFTGYVMFLPLAKLSDKRGIIKLISIVVLLLVSSIEVVFPSVYQLPFGIGRGALAAAFMLVGYWLKCNNLFKKSHRLNISLSIIALAIFIISLCLGSDGSSFVRSYYGPYGFVSVLITFVGGVCGSILLLQLCRLIDNLPFAKIKNFLSYVGRNVMIFYLLHMLVKFILDAIYIFVFNGGEVMLDEYKMALLPENALFYMLSEVVLIIAICSLIARLLEHKKR